MKNMKKKRILAALLASVAAASVMSLAGCGFGGLPDAGQLEKMLQEEQKKLQSELNNSKTDTDTEKTDAKYVTGVGSTVALRAEKSATSEMVVRLDLGDEVQVLSEDAGGYSFVKDVASGKSGYLESYYLTDDKDAVCQSETYYVDATSTDLLSASDKTSVVKHLYKGDEVTILAEPKGDLWPVYATEAKAAGYVRKASISKQKPSTSSAASSKAEDTSSKEKETSSKQESSKPSSQSSNSQNNSGEYIGSGSAPSNYYVFYAKVDSGYLALRNARNNSSGNIIGEMYTGDEIYVINSDGQYWYCYSPKLGKYGYANSEYIVNSNSSSTNQNQNQNQNNSKEKWYVHVDTGYLALRNATAYDDSNIIGELYNGDYVTDVEYNNYSDTYWFVYAPSLGKYGYVNSDYIFN